MGKDDLTPSQEGDRKAAPDDLKVADLMSIRRLLKSAREGVTDSASLLITTDRKQGIRLTDIARNLNAEAEEVTRKITAAERLQEGGI